jgi:hypothetical protein
MSVDAPSFEKFWRKKTFAGSGPWSVRSNQNSGVSEFTVSFIDSLSMAYIVRPMGPVAPMSDDPVARQMGAIIFQNA